MVQCRTAFLRDSGQYLWPYAQVSGMRKFRIWQKRTWSWKNWGCMHLPWGPLGWLGSCPLIASNWLETSTFLNFLYKPALFHSILLGSKVLASHHNRDPPMAQAIGVWLQQRHLCILAGAGVMFTGREHRPEGYWRSFKFQNFIPELKHRIEIRPKE